YQAGRLPLFEPPSWQQQFVNAQLLGTRSAATTVFWRHGTTPAASRRRPAKIICGGPGPESTGQRVAPYGPPVWFPDSVQLFHDSEERGRRKYQLWRKCPCRPRLVSRRAQGRPSRGGYRWRRGNRGNSGI